MKSLEVNGKTVEEALQSALKQLGVNREEVEVTVVKEGRSGFLGLGSEEAMVRVKSLVEKSNRDNNIAEVAKQVLESLFSRMGITASVEPQAEPSVGGEDDELGAPIAFDVRGDDLGILIGRRGQTLSCLQYIVRLIVGRQTDVWAPIVIDVEGYKQRHYEALRALAWRIAEQVKAKGESFALEPMLAYERRIIHLALAESPDVTTQSVGEGGARKVVILPKEQ